jgi:4-amino-4-deoxy-L-arabinose transferase-like glycosyltransferase
MTTHPSPTLPASSTDGPLLTPPRHFWIVALGLTALVFGAIAPTLTWLEFSNSAEALNVATALEIRRGDSPWLIPSLQGETRLQKPPLTSWITALAITDSTMQRISSTDAAQRQRGFLALAWQTRWPGLLAGCVMLLATAQIGRTLAGRTCGIASLIAAGSSLLFLRFSRYGTVDIQLAMWVAITNMLLIEALLRNRRWIGFIGAGAALAMAMLTKGPVALLQSVVPVALWYAFARGEKLDSALVGRKRSLALPAILGVVTFLALALPWFLLVLRQEPNAIRIWFTEVTREGATESKPKPWYTYGILLPYLAPWFVFLIGGAIIAVRHLASREILPIFLLVAPIVLMSFAKDRDVRYLLPMLPAAAVLVGIGVTELLSLTAASAAHWIVLAAIAVGFPIAVRFVDPPWYSRDLSLGAAGIAALAILVGVLQQRLMRSSMLFMTLLIMLGLAALFISGYRVTREGSAELRPMAEHIVAAYPNAEVFNAHPRGKRPPPELGVYLNRVLRLIDDPSQLVPGDKPKVVLMLQDKSDPPPAPMPGWRLIESRKRDKDMWWAFALPPVNPSR